MERMGLTISRPMKVQAIEATTRPLNLSPVEGEETLVEIELKVYDLVGCGHFSSVYKALCFVPNQTQSMTVALKKTTFKVLPTAIHKDREVCILRSLCHVNIVRLLYFFTREDSHGNIDLCLVLEFLPETMACHLKQARQTNVCILPIETKLWSLQMFRAIQHLHEHDICHRDIKPANLLINRETALLKVADFGSAKRLDPCNNIVYIVSRWYRAPELILKNRGYTKKIDIWSCGCVLGELLKNIVLFPAYTDSHQLLIFTRILGTPNHSQISQLCPNNSFYPTQGYPPRSWTELMPATVNPTAGLLMNQLLQWSPEDRPSCDEILSHQFYSDITDHKYLTLPNGNMVDPSILEETQINPHLPTSLH